MAAHTVQSSDDVDVAVDLVILYTSVCDRKIYKMLVSVYTGILFTVDEIRKQIVRELPIFFLTLSVLVSPLDFFFFFITNATVF